MVISHRGKKTGEKENSIAAFEKAFAMGAGGIECDARLLPDGEVIISHDPVSKFDKNVLTLSQLLDYAKKKNKLFFMELKSSSPVLVDKIAQEISDRNLWTEVCVIGFSVMVKTAFKMQNKYPKLRVIPFLNIPVLSMIRLPKKSYGIFMGWIDEWRWSQKVFQTFISEGRLKKLRDLYERNGFKVFAGVINNEKGLRYFKNAGITDIVTDEIELATKILNSK